MIISRLFAVFKKMRLPELVVSGGKILIGMSWKTGTVPSQSTTKWQRK